MTIDDKNFSPSWVGLTLLLMLSMGMPMTVFFSISILGPGWMADLGISAEQLGLLTSSTFGLAALLSPWAGRGVQHFGSRMGLVCLFVSVGLSLLLVSLLPGYEGLVVGLMFCGVAQALCNPATNLLIAQQVPMPRRALTIAFKHSGVQISALLLGTMLPWLVAQLGWRTALGIWVPLAWGLALLVWFWLPRRTLAAEQGGERHLARRQWLFTLMSVQFCAGVVLSSFVTFLGVRATGLGVSVQTVGQMVAAFGMTGIVSRLLLTPLSARLSEESRLLCCLFTVAGLGIASMQQASADTLWLLWLGVVGIAGTLPASQTIAMNMLLRDRRFGAPARSAGLLAMGFFSGCALGPPVIGALVERFSGFSVPSMALIGVLLLGCLLSLCLMSLRRRPLDIALGNPGTHSTS
ncbi:MAG: MFS transporter [Lautropia sp.]|nr:MFS transporter [Lautropia sp.]